MSSAERIPDEVQPFFDGEFWIVGDEAYLPTEWCACGREPISVKGVGQRCYQAAYFQRPEVKAKKAAFMAAYRERPEVKAKKAAASRRAQIGRLEARLVRLREIDL